MTALATVQDLATYMQRTFTGDQLFYAEQALDFASAAIRTATGQSINRSTSTVDIDPCHGNALRLPEWPAEAPTSVQVDGVAVTDWTYRAGFLYRLAGWQSYVDVNGAPSYVTVTYSHGYVSVPDDIKRVCLQAAARTMRNPGGVQTESTGPFSVTYASPSDVDLTNDEIRTVRRVLGLTRIASVPLR